MSVSPGGCSAARSGAASAVVRRRFAAFSKGCSCSAGARFFVTLPFMALPFRPGSSAGVSAAAVSPPGDWPAAF